MAKRAARQTRGQGSRRTLTADQALIALFIGAMEANDRTSAEEAARAHHLIWSTHQFRRRSGEAVGRLIEETRRRTADTTDRAPLMDRAARAIPRRQRLPAFAVLADLLLADGRLDRREAQFLRTVGAALGLERRTQRSVVDVVLLKNRL